MSKYDAPSRREDFEIAIVCALPLELDAISLIFDEFWDEDGDKYGKARGDPNTYTTGRIRKYHVVAALLPTMGKISAASAIASLRSSYTALRLALLVGICGGVPSIAGRDEIVLGDVVISKYIIQYDLGRQHPSKFVPKMAINDMLSKANKEIRSLLATFETELGHERLQRKTVEYLAQLQLNADKNRRQTCYQYPGVHADKLFASTYIHQHHGQSNCTCEDSLVACKKAVESTCEELQCDTAYLVPRQRLQMEQPTENNDIILNPGPQIFFGTIGSGDTVMKSGKDRDKIASAYELVAFDMEGAGMWEEVPCIVVKGVCNYADTHKSKQWQPFAAATAASATKALLDRYIQTDPLREHRHFGTARPNPTVIIPFPPDPDFVPRDSILDQVHKKCAMPGSRAALLGLGGVGKSQIAIAYVYKIQKEAPKTWVFWVHASNATRFEQSFLDIASYIEITGYQDPQANVFQLLHDWLLNERNGKWLLIIDNFDDSSFLTTNDRSGRYSQPLLSYIPQCQNGSILLTSRSRNAAKKLVERHDIIDVNPMDMDDSLTLLKTKLGELYSEDDATVLATTLEFMPLAIVQAASLIYQRAPRYSIRQYVSDFQKNDRKKASLLKYDDGQLRRDREAGNSIIITWQMSFDHVLQVRPSAADLLSLMSFFDRQGIPEFLLRDRSGLRSTERKPSSGSDNDDLYDSFSQSSGSDNEKFEHDIMTLRDYSFISVNTDGTTFEMHGLMQLATRQWLKAHGQQEKWKRRFIKNLFSEVPTGEYEYWGKWQVLFPHAKSAAALRPKEHDSLQEWASVLYKAAWYAYEIGNGVEAEKMAVEAMKVRMNILGMEHESTLSAMAMAAITREFRGLWNEAEELEVQVMETRKRKFGMDHPDTLSSINTLVATYMNQGRWEVAEELLVEVMKTSKTLGADHPSRLTSMSNLAMIYRSQGRLEAAEELQMKVVEITKESLGADHLDALTSISNLAMTYRSQGRWEAAEKLQVQVMETNKKKLGVDHPSTLISISNLAVTYRSQGRLEAAEALQVQVLETSERKLGADHPTTLIIMSNLATTYRNQGRLEAAEELQVQVLEMSKKKLGEEHRDTLSSMKNLALTLKALARDSEAISMMENYLRSTERVSGTEHPKFMASMTKLNEWKEAHRKTSTLEKDLGHNLDEIIDRATT